MTDTIYKLRHTPTGKFLGKTTASGYYWESFLVEAGGRTWSKITHIKSMLTQGNGPRVPDDWQVVEYELIEKNCTHIYRI